MSLSFQILHVGLALLAVATTGRLVGRLLAVVGQPPVVGEVIGGILLGPSLLGLVWPAAHTFLLPADIVPWLGLIAEAGVVLYMFIVGLDLDTGALRGQVRSTVTIACVAMAIRFGLGAALGASLYASTAPAGVTALSFNLFMGVAMSIVAFPVLARILTDTALARTPLGVRALAVAAVADLVAWCVLAVVIGIVQARPGQALTVTIAAAAAVAAILGIIRPLIGRLVRAIGDGPPGPGAMALVLAGLLVVAVVASRLGVHPIAGAFLYGAAVPHESTLARALVTRLSRVVSAVMLPAFFAYVGLKTVIGLVSGPDAWGMTAIIVLVATAGTFGATFVAARAAGRPTRESVALGVLMNTRGLMELVVLNVGLELGVISPPLFAMMVVMAIVTTVLTTPLLRGLPPAD